MKESILFIAGVYGVGKTTLCNKLSAILKMPTYSASDLIFEAVGEQYGVNKAVSDKTKNQYALIDAVKEKLQIDDSIILSGHFCIFDHKNNIEILPEFVFKGLHIKAIILLETNIDVVIENLVRRDSRSYPLAAIKALIENEKAYALSISNKLNIPIYIHKMNFYNSDVEMILDFINNI